MAMVLIIDGSSEYVAHVEKKYLSVFTEEKIIILTLLSDSSVSIFYMSKSYRANNYNYYNYMQQ